MKRRVAIGRIKTLEDASKYIDQLAAAINDLSEENERIKAQLNATEPAST